jgi:hypothetical protein
MIYRILGKNCKKYGQKFERVLGLNCTKKLHIDTDVFDTKFSHKNCVKKFTSM